MNTDTEIIFPQKGDFVRKNNFLPFYSHNEQHKVTPRITVKIEAIKKTTNSRIYRINEQFAIESAKITIISEEEANRLEKEFAECRLVESTKTDLSTCVREDTGEPKHQIHSVSRMREIVFRYRQILPGALFEGYKCNLCGHYHTGKVRQGSIYAFLENELDGNKTISAIQKFKFTDVKVLRTVTEHPSGKKYKILNFIISNQTDELGSLWDTDNKIQAPAYFEAQDSERINSNPGWTANSKWFISVHKDALETFRNNKVLGAMNKVAEEVLTSHDEKRV